MSRKDGAVDAIFQSVHLLLALTVDTTEAFAIKIMGPRGPCDDLCAVVVTMSQCSKGDGTASAATRPDM